MNRLVTSSRWQVSILTLWVLLAIGSFPFASQVNRDLDTSARLNGSESAAVEAALQQRFKSPFTKVALLRVASGPDPRTFEGRETLRRVSDAIKATVGVQGVMSYLDRDDGLFIAQDASPILIVGVSTAKDSRDSLMSTLHQVTETLRQQLETRFPGLAFRWTGEAAVNADMRRLSASATRAAELGALPLTLILLLLAFGSVVSALLPVLCGALTILVSLGILSLANRIWPTSIIVVSIVSMVGLGLSIDYALLIVSRCRDAYERGLVRAAAVADATEHAGRTVVISGSAVAIGFGTMLFVPVSEVRSIGMGGLLVSAVAVLVANTLLPILLVRMGPLIDAGRVGRRRSAAMGRNWRRWASWVSRHPRSVLAVGGIPLLVLALHAVHLRTDLPRGRWLPESADSVRALHEIDAVARGNFGQIIQIVLELPSGTSIQDESGWRAASLLVRHYARDARIQHVWAVTTVIVKPLSGPELLAHIPIEVRRSLVSADGGAVLIQLLPKPGLAAADAAAIVREIRAANPQTLTGIAGTRLMVGGVPAFNIDYENAIKRSLGIIAAIVVGATLLVLSIAFRSVLIPLKAVALNLLSVAASFGAVTLVFQDGLGSRLLGLAHPMDGGFPIVPVLVFGIVFGLSMDYEVFLMARIADGRREGLSDAAALVDGIAGIGRVITFAASIMIVIFGGFVFGEFVLIKILGFALGVAVLLDATVIRLAVGPALIQLAGRWNWWPGQR
ncbi:MAG: MMPL family transporter [Pseudomonadota bacterium]|nr:MMPL family transporter [Pseudomonadota bacterium]